MDQKKQPDTRLPLHPPWVQKLSLCHFELFIRCLLVAYCLYAPKAVTTLHRTYISSEVQWSSSGCTSCCWPSCVDPTSEPTDPTGQDCLTCTPTLWVLCCSILLSWDPDTWSLLCPRFLLLVSERIPCYAILLPRYPAACHLLVPGGLLTLDITPICCIIFPSCNPADSPSLYHSVVWHNCFSLPFEPAMSFGVRQTVGSVSGWQGFSSW